MPPPFPLRQVILSALLIGLWLLLALAVFKGLNGYAATNHGDFHDWQQMLWSLLLLPGLAALLVISGFIGGGWHNNEMRVFLVCNLIQLGVYLIGLITAIIIIGTLIMAFAIAAGIFINALLIGIAFLRRLAAKLGAHNKAQRKS